MTQNTRTRRKDEEGMLEENEISFWAKIKCKE